jgi:hypothetical protein
MNCKNYLLKLETLRDEKIEAGDEYGASVLQVAIDVFIEQNEEDL